MQEHCLWESLACKQISAFCKQQQISIGHQVLSPQRLSSVYTIEIFYLPVNDWHETDNVCVLNCRESLEDISDTCEYKELGSEQP